MGWRPPTTSLVIAVAVAALCAGHAPARSSARDAFIPQRVDVVLPDEPAPVETAEALRKDNQEHTEDAGATERERSLEELPPVESRFLGPAPRDRDRRPDDGAAGATIDHGFGRTAVALVIVIALIFGLRWIIRRSAGRISGVGAQLGPGGRAPSGVLSVLARYPIGRGQSLVLLHMDQRILLLNQTQQGFRTLAEISDPEEVASMLIKTRDEEGESMARRFTSMLRKFERDPEIVQRDIWPDRDDPAPLIGSTEPSPEETADALDSLRKRMRSLEGAGA